MLHYGIDIGIGKIAKIEITCVLKLRRNFKLRASRLLKAVHLQLLGICDSLKHNIPTSCIMDRAQGLQDLQDLRLSRRFRYA
jgi:hypothetical protein